MGVILVAGGTGFIGTTLVKQLLSAKKKVVVLSRASTITEAFERQVTNGAHKDLLIDAWNRKLLYYLLEADLTNRRWAFIDHWMRELFSVGLDPISINSIVNLAGRSSGSAQDIHSANVASAKHLSLLASAIKKITSNLLFIHMGSVSEKIRFPLPSSYALAKRDAIQLLKKDDNCDYHIIACFVRGSAEKKLAATAPRLLPYIYLLPNWFHGFKISVVDVEDLAWLIRTLLMNHNTISHCLSQVGGVRPFEISITNGEMTFGEMVSCLIDSDKQIALASIKPLPGWSEKLILRFFKCLSESGLFHQNPLINRLGIFARLALLQDEPESQEAVNHYLDVGCSRNIRMMALKPYYPDFSRVLADDHSTYAVYCPQAKRLFVSVPKDHQTLRAIVRRSGLD